jgi:hypothetical protein
MNERQRGEHRDDDRRNVEEWFAFHKHPRLCWRPLLRCLTVCPPDRKQRYFCTRTIVYKKLRIPSQAEAKPCGIMRKKKGGLSPSRKPHFAEVFAPCWRLSRPVTSRGS